MSILTVATNRDESDVADLLDCSEQEGNGQANKGDVDRDKENHRSNEKKL